MEKRNFRWGGTVDIKEKAVEDGKYVVVVECVDLGEAERSWVQLVAIN